MKLHEYQAKSILASYGMPVPRSGVATTPQEARDVARHVGTPAFVKAQVHAGGRGKGGGIKLIESAEQAEDVAASMLGSRLISPQTSLTGAPISIVLVEESLDIEYELYLGIVIDAIAQAPVVIASKAGGMEIEEIALEHPGLILREVVQPTVGFRAYQGRRLAHAMGLPSNLANPVADQMMRLYKAFVDKDCSLVEINPLVITKSGQVMVLDAKMTIDDDAAFRQPDMPSLRDWTQEDILEAKAGQAGLAYVKLDGDVGCLVNGAGLAMATMDAIKASGCFPANFLDVGGGAEPIRVAEAMGIILADPQVKKVLINVFGGIARCDDIAEGIVRSYLDSGKELPLVVRFLGTNKDEGIRILKEAKPDTIFVDYISEATKVLQDITIQ
jgi:succinyl-CoA synthetase beta subunit